MCEAASLLIPMLRVKPSQHHLLALGLGFGHLTLAAHTVEALLAALSSCQVAGKVSATGIGLAAGCRGRSGGFGHLALSAHTVEALLAAFASCQVAGEVSATGIGLATYMSRSVAAAAAEAATATAAAAA